MRRPGQTLESARLTLRRFTWADLDDLAALLADPEVTRYLGGSKDRAGAESMMRTRVLEYYRLHPGLGMWATIERATVRFVGFHVLNHIHGEPDIQVGYALVREAWGRGYATEMAVRLLAYGFDDLRLPRIAAITDIGNVASQRVLLKAGLVRHGERAFPHPALAPSGPMAWFEAHRGTWRPPEPPTPLHSHP